MAFHKREHSKDITASASHATPLPTYYSQQLPRWTSKSAFENQRPSNTKTETFVPCYPQYAAPMPIHMPRFDDVPLPPRPQLRRLPRKSILIPWILAASFFLLTFLLASTALDVQLFMALQRAPSNLPVQEIRIMINEDVLRGSASAYISFVTLSASAARPTAIADASPAIRDGSAVPTTTTTTGQLDAAPTAINDPPGEVNKLITVAPVPRNVGTNPTGFIKVVKMV
ncbi:uncharacterized protein M421DRAFT_94747 [Didymella exigua CBS 183.55]|uniref:Uncharacterized protein n=1 Tax=Didymella exigua CBS 183.55 TaxID=1150837 RepID=A0A6A5RE38_9PLEO|nr:uncharacterized protein M421DRAFT_94747 [Didymella exigua CBS 183.55]KAF1925488.1 hypothetical protein M421DRAFT_94747 [Didymella exigua CBS 183.55]